MSEAAPRRVAPALNAPPLPPRTALVLPPLLLLLAAWGAPPAKAAEYRDPEGRLTIALPEGYQEIDRPALQARLEELRRDGVKMPTYAAAFDRGMAPRFTYPYALLEIVPVPGAAWTTADLQGMPGQRNTEQAGRETAAAFDRMGLGSLIRDPRITFVRWEPERQAAVYRVRTQGPDAEVLGTGRIYFYRDGYITLWFYYLAGTPYADAAEQLTAGLVVLPAYRLPPPGFLTRSRPVLIGVTVGAAVMLLGLIGWLAARRRPAAAAALLLVLSLAGRAAALGPSHTMEPGRLACRPSGCGTATYF